MFLAVRHEDARIFAANIEAYRQAWREAGHPGDGMVYLRAPGFVAATADAARDEAEASLMVAHRTQAALLRDSAGRAGVDGADQRARTAERLHTITYGEALRAPS